MIRLKHLPAVAGIVATALAVGACGSSSGGSSGGGGGGGGTSAAPTLGKSGANVAVKQGQQKGGTLNLQSAEGWEHLDPGTGYFQIDYVVLYSTQRPLYSFLPDNGKKAVPDLADGEPQISADGKTVTVHIRKGIMFGGAVHREVTSDDVAYAFERDFNPNVQNAYASSYYPIVGSDTSKGGKISGISTPDKYTIVFQLKSKFGGTFAQALVLPGSAPVPRDYAAPLDKKTPVTYDSDPTKQAFTGPYIIQDYNAGRSLTMVRNPAWKASTDFRPAYADKIVWKAGGDSNVVARQTLASSDLLMADGPPASQLQSAYQTKRKQLSISPIGNYYASLNTQVKPFNNVNLRRAVVAAENRQAYLLARGGKLVGQVATSFLPPTDNAFAASGGEKGFGFDFLKSPTGDMAVAKKYMKAAGYPSGKYTGNEKVLIVGANSDPGPKEMQIVQNGLQKLGFKTQIKAVPQQTMYSKFCGYVKAHVNVCPTAGWLPDFPDSYAALYVPFSGKAIVPVNNSNWAVLNDPKINAAMDAAAALTDPDARTKAWANVNKMITSIAPAIPEINSQNALVKGSGVKGVLDTWNDDWDLAFSSPK